MTFKEQSSVAHFLVKGTSKGFKDVEFCFKVPAYNKKTICPLLFHRICSNFEKMGKIKFCSLNKMKTFAQY